MSEKEDSVHEKSTEERKWIVPQGFSSYGISSGHSISVKQPLKRSLIKDLLYGMITIVGVILILLILNSS
ncbi:MAG: hypothetical protein ACW98F_16345 [Candidatus Hodarchaeales archaeon]|jgi:hypothetical protein